MYTLPAATAVNRARQGDLALYAPLRSVLIGPCAGLHRYSVAAERALLGAYDKLAEQTYAYPDKATGSVVDLNSIRLIASTADLNYFNKYTGSGGSAQPSSTFPNRVRAANYIFKTGNGYDRSADFYDRDVAIGDVVYIRGDDSGTVELTSFVTGFVGEPVAAVTGSAEDDDNNAATQTLAVAIEQVEGTPFNDIEATADASAYESTNDGYINRTYTITVTQGSTGGDATTALLRVRSADGLDDADDVTPAAFSSPTDIGSKGLTVTFSINPSASSASSFGIDEDDFVVGQEWTVDVEQAFTAPTATASGTYTGVQDTTYIIAVTRGGTYAGSTKPQITVTSSNGYDQSGPTSVTAAASAVAVGNYGIMIAFDETALRKGDVYYIEATAPSEAQIRTLVLQHDVPEGIRGTEVDVRLFVRRTSLAIPAIRTEPTDTTNWSVDADGITIADGILIVDSEFTDGGDAVPIALDSAELYVSYREWLSGGAGTIVSISDPSDIEGLFGTVDPSNPIAYAASKALGTTDGELSGDPARACSDTTDRVFCITIGGDPADLTLWTAALELIEENEEAYGLVPLSRDPAVYDLFVAHVASQSADSSGFYRSVWLSAILDETGAIESAATTSDGEPFEITIAATVGSSPTAYTTVTATSNARFITRGVRAGDTLRYDFGVDAYNNETYTEYAVASVLSETTLVLAAGPDAAVAVARRGEVWRAYTKAELVTQLTTKAAAYGSERVRYVWPDRFGFGGTALHGYNLCAILGGLTGSVPSHQNLKNVTLPGVDDLTRSSRFFTSSQLSALAAGGLFVCSQSANGTPYIRTPWTTDPSAADTQEEMIVRNGDMIRKAVQTEWAPYVGAGNVLSNLGQLLGAALRRLTDRLRAAGFTDTLGPPVADLLIASIAPVEGDPRAVTVTLTVVGIAVPLNQIQVVLPIDVG